MKKLFKDAKITEADPEETFKLINADGSGRISRKEFEDWIVSADPVATKLRESKMAHSPWTLPLGMELIQLVGGKIEEIERAKQDIVEFEKQQQERPVVDAVPPSPSMWVKVLREYEGLGVLLKAEGPEEEQTIAAAVDATYANDASLRRLRHFKELLSGSRRPQPGDLADRLGAWIGEGEHAWMFDNPEDRLDLTARVLGFDMTALLENPRLRTPTMMYLFHRIEERLDGKPTMILIDEGWKALDDEVFAARIRDWLKTLRKRNALVGFATQSARDALESRISTALVEQTATMVFMPNSRARPEDYCDGFGLTEHELALIRTLPAHSRCFLVRQPDASVVVRLDLSGAPEVLTLLSGRESSVRRLDLLREALGDAPREWFPALTGTKWPGGANDHGDAGIEALGLAAE